MEGLDLSSLTQGVVDNLAVSKDAAESVSQVETTPGVSDTGDELPVEEKTVEEEVGIKAQIEEAEPETMSKEEMEAVTSIADEIIEESKEEEVNTNEEGDDNSMYSTLAEFLGERGILDKGLDIKDEDSFVKAIQNTIEQGKFAGLSDSQKQYINAVEAGVEEDVATSLSNNIKALEEMKDSDLSEDLDTARLLIKDDLAAQGWDEERITKQLERLGKTDELYSEGLTARDNIIANNKQLLKAKEVEAVTAKEQAQKNLDKQVETLKEGIYSTNKVMDTITADDRLKNQVYEAMTVPVGYTEEGTALNALTKDRQDDPIDFERRLYYAYVLTNGFRDNKKLQRRADSAAARKLKHAVTGLGTGSMSSNGSTPYTPDKSVPDIVKV